MTTNKLEEILMELVLQKDIPYCNKYNYVNTNHKNVLWKTSRVYFFRLFVYHYIKFIL